MLLFYFTVLKFDNFLLSTFDILARNIINYDRCVLDEVENVLSEIWQTSNTNDEIDQKMRWEFISESHLILFVIRQKTFLLWYYSP